jgi:hypothetical protein
MHALQHSSSLCVAIGLPLCALHLFTCTSDPSRSQAFVVITSYRWHMKW